MKIKAIGINTALATVVFMGLTLGHQESAVAQRGSGGGNCGSGSNSGKGCGAKIPTPALLPGLIALGAGVLRKHKAEAAEVDD